MYYAIRYETTNSTRNNVDLSKWHCTRDGKKTLCNMSISHSENNEENENTDLIDCARCLRTIELDNLL